MIDPWIVTKKFATENPAAAARFVEAGLPRQRVDHEGSARRRWPGCSSSTRTSASTATRPRRATRSATATIQTLDQALADMRSGASEKALTETAQVFVAGGAYDKVPDLERDEGRSADPQSRCRAAEVASAAHRHVARKMFANEARSFSLVGLRHAGSHLTEFSAIDTPTRSPGASGCTPVLNGASTYRSAPSA